MHEEVIIITVHRKLGVEPQHLRELSLAMTSMPSVCCHMQHPIVANLVKELPHDVVPKPPHVFILLQRPQMPKNPFQVVRAQVCAPQQL